MQSFATRRPVIVFICNKSRATAYDSKAIRGNVLNKIFSLSKTSVALNLCKGDTSARYIQHSFSCRSIISSKFSGFEAPLSIMRHSTPASIFYSIGEAFFAAGVILSEIAHRRNLKVVVEERIDLQMEEIDGSCASSSFSLLFIDSQDL